MAWVLRAICYGCRKTFQTMSEPERHQICFFTPSTICCGGVVLDYSSMMMMMIINELKEDLNAYRYALVGIYIFLLFNSSDGRLHHVATFPFTVVLNDSIDHYKTFNKMMHVWSKQLYVKYGGMHCDKISKKGDCRSSWDVSVWDYMHHMHDFCTDITYMSLSLHTTCIELHIKEKLNASKRSLKWQHMQDTHSEQWGFSQLRKLSLFIVC